MNFYHTIDLKKIQLRQINIYLISPQHYYIGFGKNATFRCPRWWVNIQGQVKGKILSTNSILKVLIIKIQLFIQV